MPTRSGLLQLRVELEDAVENRGLYCGFVLWLFKSREEKRTQPPPKENLLENFSGLGEKLSRPVVDTKPYKNQENHIHHRNLSSVDPIFSAKKSSALEQGGVWFLVPSKGFFCAIAPLSRN